MNTLRVKIALLMVVVIVSVVFSLTLVLFYLLGPQAGLFARAGSAAGGDAAPRRRGRHRSGRARAGARARADGFTQKLRDALTARGINLAVEVSRDGWRAPLMVSVPVGDRDSSRFRSPICRCWACLGGDCSDGCC